LIESHSVPADPFRLDAGAQEEGANVLLGAKAEHGGR
jgi:hypothetical protein